MPAPSAHLSPGNHLIVCGDTPLAYRLIRELTHRYHESVVVILPGRLQNNGPRISAISGITVLERAELTSGALREAGVATARAAAMVGWDDLANFHAALRAQELNPDLRIVVGADNRRLGDHITGLLRDCTVLSSSQLAGPALVAAALGEIAPSHVRVTGQTLYVAGRGSVPVGHVLCGLAVSDDPDIAAQLVAPDDVYGDADLVLAVDDGTPRDVAARERHPVLAARNAVRRFAANTVRLARWARRHPRGALRGLVRQLARNKFAAIFAVLLAVAISGFILLASTSYGAGNVVYLGIMDLTGSALTNASDHGTEKVAQVLLTADGMALLPVVTALIVGARLTGRIRGEPKPGDGHVIVVGGGEVGVRVLGGLYDLGFHAVLIDQDQNARGAAFARNHRLPGVIGASCDEATVRHQGLQRGDLGDQQRHRQPGDRAAGAGDARRGTARGAQALRRRPGRAGAADGRQRRVPVGLVPGRAGLRGSDARAQGAAHHRRRQARAADRRCPGGARHGDRGPDAGGARARPARPSARAAEPGRASLRLVAAPLAPPGAGRSDNCAGYQGWAIHLPGRQPAAGHVVVKVSPCRRGR